MKKTDEEINAAVAAACGWVDVILAVPWQVEYPEDFSPIPCGVRPAHDRRSSPLRWGPVPNYCNDLNAMHEAEKTLRREQYEDYLDNLCITLGGELYTSARETHADVLFLLANKTAKQKAEAFLRTLGKW